MRRVRVQPDGPWELPEDDPRRHAYRGRVMPPGTISWEEHIAAWERYAERFDDDQSAERIAERGGFGYAELVMLLGCDPATWQEKL